MTPSVERAHGNTLSVFENGPAPGLDIDLTITVAGGFASFLFVNNSTGGAAGSDVHEIYFESGLASLLKTPGVLNSAGTLNALFTAPAKPSSPPGLPGGWTNLGGGPYGNAPGGANMISVGDAWAIRFELVSPLTTANDILNAVFNQSGNSRIALHIGDCNRTSCGALVINDPPNPGPGPGEVPLPAAAWLFGSVLVGGSLVSKWRRRRKGLDAAA
jgi:hypothetical protein